MTSFKRRGPARLGFVLSGVIAVSVLSVAPPAAMAGGAAAKPETTFISFPAFIQQLRGGTLASATDGVSSAQFSQAKSYLVALYKGVDVRATFITDGSYFDCVTVITQPTVTALGIKRIATPPATLPAFPHDATESKLWTTTGLDPAGRVVSCPAGTVPMRRVTMSQVLSFHSVRDFLSKNGSNGPAADIPGYRHAFGYDTVANDGGGMDVNVWNPKVVSTTNDHSLSQEWVTGSGATASEFQTAEAGWTKDPEFSKTDPVYFVYWTANDYQTTGCYDLDCPGFVQVSKDIGLGAPVSPCCSTKGKVNDSFTQYYILFKGNWFLYNDSHEIGYLPTSIYNGGTLATGSTQIQYGGEVYGGAATVNWPPMGSGAFAKAGPLKAAYQSSLEYFVGTKAFDPSLTTLVTGGGSTPSPCYSLSYTPAKGQTGPFFYYGGPGGKQGKC